MEEALSFLGTYLVNHVFKAVLRQIPFAVILVVSACVLLFVLLRRLYVVWHMIALRLLLVSAALTCILLMGASKMSANCDSGWTYYEETMRCYKVLHLQVPLTHCVTVYKSPAVEPSRIPYCAVFPSHKTRYGTANGHNGTTRAGNGASVPAVFIRCKKYFP